MSKCLQGPTTSIRSEALAALAQIGKKAKKAVPEIIKKIDDKELQKDAITTLRSIVGETVVSIILKSHKDSYDLIGKTLLRMELEGAIVFLIHELHKQNTTSDIDILLPTLKTEILIRILSHQGYNINRQVKFILKRRIWMSQKQDKSIMPKIISALEKEPPNTKIWLMYLLQDMRPKVNSATPVLIKLAKVSNDRVAALAIHTLGKISQETNIVVNTLRLSLEDRKIEVRLQGAFSLLNMKGENTSKIQSIFIEGLESKDKKINLLTMSLLGELRKKGCFAVAKLNERFDKGDRIMQKALKIALRKISNNK